MSASNDYRATLTSAWRQVNWQPWPGIAGGLTGGLFISRSIAEASAGPWPLRWLLPLVAACAVSGGVLGFILSGRLKLAPLLVLLIYLFWPQPSLVAGTCLAAFTMILLLLANKPSWPRDALFAGILSIGFFILYVATLAPGLLPADSGEFQLVSAVLGIAHPPGYALYTMLGKLFTLVPVGSSAYRVNLMSAVFSAATLGILCRTIERQVHSRGAALVGVLVLGLSPTFWAQSTTANIRSLTVLLAALTIAALLRWGADPKPRSLALFGLFFGLGVGHHASLALLGIPYLVYILCMQPRIILQPKQWLPVLGAFAASFLVLLYLPLRSAMQPAFDPAPIRTWADFWDHVLALGFKGDLFYIRSLAELLARLNVGSQILRIQFGLGMTIIAGLAFIPLILRRWKIALLLGGAFLVNALAVVTYRAPQTVEYLLPAYLCLSLILGLGIGLAAQKSPWGWLWHTGLAVILVVVLAQGWLAGQTARLTRQDQSTISQATTLLTDAPQDAVILANWHESTPLWYLQTVEGLRPDITIEYVYPQGAAPNEQTWLSRIAAWISSRPVIVTNWFYGYSTSAYSFTPFDEGWVVSETPAAALPVGMTPTAISFDPGISIKGMRLQAASDPTGRKINVSLVWLADETFTEGLTCFVQVLGPEGVIGQADQGHAIVQAGQLQIDRFELALLPQALPGTYQVIAGFYTNQGGSLMQFTSQGQNYAPLSDYSLEASREPLPAGHQVAAAWANGLTLTGYDLDDSFGGQRRLYLHLAQAHPGLLQRSAPTRSEEAFQLQVIDGDQILASKSLGALAEGSYQVIALDLPAHTGKVTIRLRTGEGTPIPALAAWHRLARHDVVLRLPVKPETFIPFADGIALAGTRVSSGNATASQTVELQAVFLSQKPQTRDYTVSLGLRTEAGWETKDDGTPALGAIPTLKWGWGWNIKDTHLLNLPADIPSGTASLTVELYDAFALQPLQILDERRVREGQGTTVVLPGLQLK
ncbi:MAG: protein O-mannosyl-transferase family [Anaerolineae bacterium]